MKKLLNKKYLIIGVIVLIVIIGLVIYLNTKESNVLAEEIKEEDIKEIVEVDSDTLEKCYVKVDVKGYVNNPGLYEVECDNRVIDAINKAGGLKKNANTSVINLSKKVFDQMVIIIYSDNEVRDFIKVKEEEKIKEEKCINNTSVKNDACVESNDSKKEIKEEVTSSSRKVSLNNATLEELMTLTGIGESKAINIISYREENNGFKNIEEIMNISGIGEKAYEKIKDNLTL